ncbi:SANT/Myb_domain [Hexamita inflata]|uniref:SANT/Myb domain n=1 Tax=Hexamita inflata TaxID=28002 RepID=A0AA86N5W4_9EUKA|nr:SANT/Myb domain [Hexamita inflata]
MKRIYHQWTDYESSRLYKCVIKCKRNWTEVQNQFPTFTKLQLQNKYLVMKKQIQKKTEIETDSQGINSDVDLIQHLINLLNTSM